MGSGEICHACARILCRLLEAGSLNFVSIEITSLNGKLFSGFIRVILSCERTWCRKPGQCDDVILHSVLVVVEFLN